MKDLLLTRLEKAFSGDLTDYQAIPFWSWNNELEEEHLIRQIEDMKAAGMGGFIMHARIGLKTEYLGEKWFSCVEACLKKARELHMNAWIYDENGWPSGFVGGKLLEREDFRAQFLEYAVRDSFDPSAFVNYRESEDGFVRVECAEEMTSGVCHCVYLRVSPANTDILNPEVVTAFLNETHEQYYKRFPESFGRELKGFFTDEPQCYRAKTSYSPFLREAYEKEFGGDIRDGLIWLFLQDARGYLFRERYYTLMNRLYTDNFFRRIYEWCDAHHCMLTGHGIEECNLYGQMLGGAGVMQPYEFEHIPGIDMLGRDCHTELMPKQVGSVASQLGIRQVLTETFACCGYDVTPKELRSIAEFQFFNGVSLMCHHLFPYSLAAQGKTDHPPVFSRQSNWWEQFRSFNDYFTRLGYLISNTEETYDVLLISPLRSAYLNYSKEGSYERTMESDYFALIQCFREHGIRFQVADEGILARHGSVHGDALTIGQRSYGTVVVPKMTTIASETLSLLQKFEGKRLVLGGLTLVDGAPAEAELTSNITMEDIFASAAFRYSCADGRSGLTSREGELGRFLFIKNYSRTEPSRVHTEGISCRYRALDLETLTLREIDDDFLLDPCGSVILAESEGAFRSGEKVLAEDITPAFRVTEISENALVLDMGEISYDGVRFGETLPLQRIFEDLLRADYRGKFWIRQHFTVSEKMPLSLWMEKGRYPEIRLNGKPLNFVQSDFDFLFMTADLSAAIQTGENELCYSVDYFQHDGVHFALFDPLATESLRNCLYYDTHIESAYVLGDFTVGEDFLLSPRRTLPPVTSGLFRAGYPFFRGTLTLSGSYVWDGSGRRILSPVGRFLVAEVTVNGVRTDLVLDDKKDITDLLRVGDNDIRIVLRASLRNFFGPHHFRPDPEPLGVNPTLFTFRGEWNGGIADRYTPVYQSVPFGADRILMLTSVREAEEK